MSNRLINETSPYLLQHAENPVDWYPWSEKAFKKAKEEDKPVFLSIGYSTCHWCHVMAHESFEDPEIAEILNNYFISIKVDKEERPDIDSIYMAVCQAFTGSGGWPTSIFMTPDQKPFFAGTYFPKTGRGVMIGMKELLLLVAEEWQKDRLKLIRDADELISQLSQINQKQSLLNAELPSIAFNIFKQSYDKINGGFGRAPKFPTPHNLIFLLSYYERYGNKECLDMVEKTLLQMYRGGIFDHIGFGFSRYSTDSKFLVPHFEKMLYDNALLILAYCRMSAYKENNGIYIEVAEKTASYVLRELTAPNGGFYSAQDADSEGSEGKYYLLSPKDVIGVLGEIDGKHFNRHFDITEEGNFEGNNIPNLLKSDPQCNTYDHNVEKLYKYRKKRYKLHLDDKILTFWNSLMITAMCELYRESRKRKYLDAAIKADRFIQENLCENGILFVSFRNGKKGVKGFLDDYAGYIYAQLALYGATLDLKYLSKAEKFCDIVLTDFADSEQSGFYLYGKSSEQLIFRPKDTYDGALPSGNSLMAWNFVRLFHLTSKEKYKDHAEQLLGYISSDAANYPAGYTMFLSALLEFYEPSAKITAVTASSEDKEKLPFIVPANAYLTVFDEPVDQYTLINEKTTYYVCKNNTCFPPVNELHKKI